MVEVGAGKVEFGVVGVEFEAEGYVVGGAGEVAGGEAAHGAGRIEHGVGFGLDEVGVKLNGALGVAGVGGYEGLEELALRVVGAQPGEMRGIGGGFVIAVELQQQRGAVVIGVGEGGIHLQDEAVVAEGILGPLHCGEHSGAVFEYHHRPRGHGAGLGEGAQGYGVLAGVEVDHPHVGEEQHILRIGGLGAHGLLQACQRLRPVAFGHGLVGPLHKLHISVGVVDAGGFAALHALLCLHCREGTGE